MNQILKILIVALFFLSSGFSVEATNPLDVVINEIAWMGTSASYNDEWIELRNNTDQEINLDGWILKAADGTPQIKVTGIIPVTGLYLLERTDDNTVPGITADQIYTGALGNNGEKLELYDNLGNLIDSVDASAGWPAGDNSTKQTMERSLSAPGADNWQISQNPGGTPMAENSSLPSLPLQEVADVGSPPILETLGVNEETPNVNATVTENAALQVVYPTGVIINEILPSPIGPDEEEEWVEIFNQNNFEVNLSGWKITDSAGKVETYIFPEETVIGPNGFLVLYRPATKITFNNQGDGLKLLQPNGNVINEVSYNNAPRGESYGRFKSVWAWTSTPTPGSTNLLPVPVSEPKEKTAEDRPPQTLTAAVGESLKLSQKDKTPKSFIPFLAAIFTSLSIGAIILILRKKTHVRT